MYFACGAFSCVSRADGFSDKQARNVLNFVLVGIPGSATELL